MTILCVGDCHVWLGSSSLCTCEAHRVAMASTGHFVYGFPQNYNPFAPTKATPPTAADRPDVPPSRLRSAERAGATHLSADGETAYDERKLGVWRCFWYEDQKRFGSWYRVVSDELPADAVRL